MKKSMNVNGVHVQLQSGMRNGKPVVACTLNYGAQNPLHFIQVDKAMLSIASAEAFVSNTNLFVFRSILSRLSGSEAEIIAGVNRVFGASDAGAAVACAKLRINSKWKQ